MVKQQTDAERERSLRENRKILKEWRATRKRREKQRRKQMVRELESVRRAIEKAIATHGWVAMQYVEKLTQARRKGGQVRASKQRSNLQKTRADIEEAVARFQRIGKRPTNKMIAKEIGKSHEYVRKVRKRVSAS